MSNKKYSLSFIFWGILFSIIICAILLILKIDYFLIIIMFIYYLLLLVCLIDISTNVFFLTFLVSFFIFLISGDLFEELFQKFYYIRFDDDAKTHSYVCIIISLIFLFLGYNFQKKKKAELLHINLPDSFTASIRQSSSIVFYLTIGILLFDTVNKVFFVSAHGYVAYYTSYRAILPLVVRKLGDFAPVSLCVFLATFPSKKKSLPIIILYIIYAFVGLLVGQRGHFVYNTVFLLGYGFYRNRNYSDGEIWITKRMIMLLITAVPFLLVFFQIYGDIRLGNKIVYKSFLDSLISFFINIGSSSKVIKYGYVYKDQLTEFRFYSLGSLINYFKYGRIFNLFALSEIPATHSAKFAIEGHSFDSIISFLSMRNQFLNGEGAGSSFIAELYADFGYIGVAFGSFLYGLIFKSISYLAKKDWKITSIKLYMMLNMIKTPRGSFDSFLAVIVNINFISLILVIYLIANSIERSKRIEYKVLR